MGARELFSYLKWENRDMKVGRKKKKDMLTAFLQCTLEDRQGLMRLNIIAGVWTSIINWCTSI